jgi:shikimate dehydrogenase
MNTQALSVSGDTRLFAIIGDPIAQARSPMLFNQLFAEVGANSILVPMQIPASHLQTAVAGLKAVANLDGIVVTVPHKVTITEAVDVLGPNAQRVGAVNCMRRLPDGRWGGEMYDGEGFVSGLRREGMEPAGWRVFQAGCGGAGKAVTHALALAGVAALDLFDVKETLQRSLVAELQRLYPQVEVKAAGGPSHEHDLLINATPCGMAAGDPQPFELEASRAEAVVADLIMKPERTSLLCAAERRGHRVHLGRHLLESQARLAARYFGLDV